MIKLLRRFQRRTKDYQKSYSQEGEDMILSEVFQQKKTGFFVDVGAFHPTRLSNTKFFYDRGWNGINIEPSPNSFKDFLITRKRDINLNLGISESSGVMPYFMFNEGALNTFDSNRVKQLETETSYRMQSQMDITVQRLDCVLEKYSSGKHIDFMNIDVECHEMAVLRSNEWSRFRPSILLVEILDFDLHTIFENKIHVFLSNNHYTFLCKTPRTCFYIDNTVK